MSETYTLKHTAEELDHKLDLIDISRNLLPYPYTTTFPTSLKNVGDGSLLTATGTSAGTVFLSEVLLPAGTFTASIEYTNKAEEPVENPGFKFEIVDSVGATVHVNANSNFVLDDPTLIKVSLVAPNVFGSECLIKPQIEAGLVKTPWAPYMKSIGSYVDERFNSTNTKIKVLTDHVDTEIAGLSERIDNLPTGGEGGGGGNANVSATTDNAILKWDKNTSKIVESTVKADDNGSILINEGTASGSHSIVGGTTDKSVITGILGSLGSIAVNAAAPSANANNAISLGSGTSVLSTGGNAIGVLNTVGVKGYYYTNIDFNAKTITLSTSRSSSSGSNLATKFKDGDAISFVNDFKFPFCCKVVGTKTSGNVITVDSLPFSSADKIVTYSAVSDFAQQYLPDDFTIFACYEETIIGDKKRWRPREGEVELGWAGTALGVMNLTTGSGAFAAGYNNWVAGDFGAAFGRNNIAGYAGLTVGADNTGACRYAIVGGNKNTVKSDNTVVGGAQNTVNSDNTVVGGAQNTVSSSGTIVSGFKNSVTNGSSQAITVGDSNTVTTGYCSAAFGKSNTLSANFAIIAGQNNILTQKYSAVFGSDNTSNAVNTLVAGLGNTANTTAQTVVGKYCKDADTSGALFVVGIGSSNDNRKNGFVVDKSGNAQVTGTLSAEKVEVKPTNATADYFRPVWFSDGANKAPNNYRGIKQGDTFQYNPATDTLKVANLEGQAQSALEVPSTAQSGTVERPVWFSDSVSGKPINKRGHKNGFSFTPNATITINGKTEKRDVLKVGGKRVLVEGDVAGSGLPDPAGYQDGAILVVRNGQWVIENPPTTVYTGEVE